MGTRICEKCARVVDVKGATICIRCQRATGRRTEYRTPWERVEAHAIRLADADTDADHRRAREGLRQAVCDWAKKAR